MALLSALTIAIYRTLQLTQQSQTQAYYRDQSLRRTRAIPQIQQHLAALRNLSIGNPQQTALLSGMEDLSQAKLQANQNGNERIPVFGQSVLTGLCALLALLVTGGLALRSELRTRRRAEQGLRRGEAEFRTMAEASPSIFYSCRSDGFRTYVSPRWMQHTGLNLEQALGFDWLQAVHPEEIQLVKDRWAAAGDRMTPFEIVYRLRCNDNEYRWVLSKAVPLLDEANSLLYWCGSVTEIHQLKELEERLRASNQDLEYFAHAVSHDLKEPLRNVTTSAQLLLQLGQRKPDSEEHELIAFIISSGTRMNLMLRGLLEYARLDEETDDSSLTWVSMEAALASALDNLRITIADTQAEIVHDPLPNVFWKETPVIQLFQNLVGNALKYHREHVAPHVHVSCKVMDDHWSFSVRDNGIGMRPADTAKVFRPFTRLHDHSNREGVGLGLAFCKRLVERRGGRIWADSEEGVGTTFFFTIPRMQSTDPAIQLPVKGSEKMAHDHAPRLAMQYAVGGKSKKQ